MTRIMVVEDTKMIAKILTAKLEKLGYEVTGVISKGEDVVETAMKSRPDLVLMDIVLEGKMDGVEAATNLKARLDIPIVYLTSCADDSTLERAKLTEPHGYLLKPLEEGELHTTIDMAIYKHDVEKKLKVSEEWFSTTLNSIGEAIIATDIESCIKYMNPAGESITGCRIGKSAGKLLSDIFVIKDNGPGIEEKYFDKVFQLFQTLAPRDERESTGIGLTLTKRIIETYGGRIWLESVAGSGTTFYFTLPKTDEEIFMTADAVKQIKK